MATLLLQLLLCCSATLFVVNTLEVAPQLFNTPSNTHELAKSKQTFAPFPLDALELNGEEGDEGDTLIHEQEQQEQPIIMHHSLPPSWLTFNEPPQKQRIISGTMKSHKTGHDSTTTSRDDVHHQNGPQRPMHKERSCYIEITTKVPGVCQPIKNLGSACVSGDYMEVLNADCL